MPDCFACYTALACRGHRDRGDFKVPPQTDPQFRTRMPCFGQLSPSTKCAYAGLSKKQNNPRRGGGGEAKEGERGWRASDPFRRRLRRTARSEVRVAARLVGRRNVMAPWRTE